MSLATLMYEISLTRIFSVTMWYHFAFMAVSIALFGMTVGAIIIYLLPKWFSAERTNYAISLSSLLFSISIVFSFLTQLSLQFGTFRSIVGLYSLALTYAVTSIPFIFSGICICLALTKFPYQVSKLYAVDLLGAAFGCMLLVPFLNHIDSPTAVIGIACIASIGTVFFAHNANKPKIMRWAVGCMLLFAFFVTGHTVLVKKQKPILRPLSVKGHVDPLHLYEKWNAFSRITIDPAPEKPYELEYLSQFSNRLPKQLNMLIDATAGTVLTQFDGNLQKIEYLKYDIANLVHYIRPNSKLLIIGTGGGKDVLSALVFNQKEVVGVEINKDIINAVNQRFGDFTGHLDKNPKVTFVNDEARSYIARSKDRFDIIQASLTDTWAATAAGAFVLSENSLYTIEAWVNFLNHLTPSGVLTFTRWYFRDLPDEMYRLTSLAVFSLQELGVNNPRNHIMIVKPKKTDLSTLGTLLVSRSPFSREDIEIIRQVARKLQFDVVLTPKFSTDSIFATIASGENLNKLYQKFPFNISPSTDDNPFFFHRLRMKDIFNMDLKQRAVLSFDINLKGIVILCALLVIVVGLTFLCIIFPLLSTGDKTIIREYFLFLIFFSAIGLGFMMIEISQMQRLIVFLGHPVYGLSVVLFSLLVGSGLGSFASGNLVKLENRSSLIKPFVFLLLVIVIFGITTPYIITEFRSSTTPVRILFSVMTLLPLGFFMGMPFPLGMKLASKKPNAPTPWLWGINGATSVCASVLSVVIALNWGISFSFWVGSSCYLLALVAITQIIRYFGVGK